MTTSSATCEKNFITVATFPFQCKSTRNRRQCVKCVIHQCVKVVSFNTLTSEKVLPQWVYVGYVILWHSTNTSIHLDTLNVWTLKAKQKIPGMCFHLQSGLINSNAFPHILRLIRNLQITKKTTNADKIFLMRWWKGICFDTFVWIMMPWHRYTFRIIGPLWGEGVHQVLIDTPHSGSVMWSFDIFFFWLTKKLLKKSRLGWFGMAWRSMSWWRHQMETFSASLAICAGNSPITGEFPAQRPVTRKFDVFFDLRLNERLSKQSWGWWFETPSRPSWRRSNVNVNWAALYSLRQEPSSFFSTVKVTLNGEKDDRRPENDPTPERRLLLW